MVGRRTRADLLRLSLASPMSSSSPTGAPTAPDATPFALPCGACWEDVGSTRAEYRGRLAPTAAEVEAVLDEVPESAIAQATPWQPTSRYSVRVGEAVEASAVKLCQDLLELRELSPFSLS